MNNFRWSSLAGILTIACLAGSLSAQGRPRRVGLPDDWSHRHLMFSNPGTYAQMLEPGVSQERWNNWLAVQQEPRFKIQQAKHQKGAPESASLQAEGTRVADIALAPSGKARVVRIPPKLVRIWAEALGAAPPANMYPAKFSFDPNGTPDCVNDFVVFPIGDFAAVGQQAKLMAFNNLYRPGLCGTATTPSFKFSYQIDAGVVQTSPVLSLDGTKIAFVASRTGGVIGQDTANFHVVTIGTTGDNGSTTAGVPIGLSGSPVVNNAVDRSVPFSNQATVTRSSPFVIYDADVAFVGDDHGFIHKFDHVFNGIMSEEVSVWPKAVGGDARVDDTILTSPVFFADRILVGGANGKLYCLTAAGQLCQPVSSLEVGITGTTSAILDPPIVDASTGRVFVAAQDRDGAILVQTTFNLDNPVRVRMGNPQSAGFNIHNGAFDHNYLTGPDPSAGFMYFCGVAEIGSAPTLYRVGFSPIGRVNDTRDAPSGRLVNASGDRDECSPLTEIYNPNTPGGPTDLLFVTITHNNHGCSGLNKNCIGSLDITSVFPTNGTNAVFRQAVQLGGSGSGTSAIVVDNVADVVPTWLAGTASLVNDLIVDSNGNVQQCTTAGTSGAGTHPVWGTLVGVVTTDAGTLRWTMRGPYRGSWQRQHAYSLNDVITDFIVNQTTGHLQRVTTAGMSGATRPLFNSATGGATTDGATLMWTNLGPYTPSGVANVYFADVRSKMAYKFSQSELK